MNEQTLNLKDRIVSIDALRGFAMFLILSTQIGGAFIFRTFNNMLWNENWPNFVSMQLSWDNQRVSFINIAQSLFVFIVGLVIPFSLNNRLLLREKKRFTFTLLSGL